MCLNANKIPKPCTRDNTSQLHCNKHFILTPDDCEVNVHWKLYILAEFRKCCYMLLQSV